MEDLENFSLISDENLWGGDENLWEGYPLMTEDESEA